MKKFFILIFAAVLIFSLAACGKTSNNSETTKDDSTDSEGFETIEITFSHNQPIESPEHAGAAKFKEVVEEKTGGKVTVNIFPASQLGSLREQVEGTQIGEIDITMQPTAVVSPFVDDVKVVDLPYLWPADKDQTYKVLDGEVGKELLGTLDKGGFKGLGYWPGGFKLFTTGKKEIHKPEDFKGLTMRVMESPLLIEQYKNWGGNAIPVPYSEVYNSLQQGVVDGQENPLQTIFLNNYHEVQKNIVESYHGTMTYLLMANKGWYDGISEQLKKVIAEAEIEGHNAARKKLADVEDDYRQKIIDSGANYYKLTDDEIEAFRQASLPMHKEVYNTPDQLKLLDKLYDAIEESKK
ncbi:TRAP transporter substrate-binding protein [Bacillus sp. DTU_2020_1000418_1_SI_GHA_SEK_038]|uniref:TRAP transporter substrate-binding protein n=1 Tax=Bacillus sp. DTU_2020_1000418_1_SI_GHA_SEK_038 TaxID=3077585 RepID=UPI0028E4E4ED|nr:TRAP transporter substrate-binding protein [Bacillus sp. DTU_2020_1000418_1_SI_GHA_SEK_038]WNS76558.1 TRAP transporter substrate-binding protein [Bacillus sp. DTU_2020_1000418_1_SI_GHA_SEK_038]